MARRRAATLHFNAIQLTGGLLPSSLIDQIARQDAPQMASQDYGLPKGMRLQVPLDQAWIRAKVLWEEAKELRSRGVDSAVGVHFSQRLLKEVFGWGDLQACDPRQIGEASYPINFRAFGGTVPLVLTSLPTEGLDNGYKQFGQDNRRRSPHSCLQECLNADDGANWGVLCNGSTIRLLHDNPALVKPAYVSVGLEAIFDGGLFDEFTVLWLLLHASRFQRDGEGQCVLDGWKEKGQETGERALNKLRDGVQQALESLGNGFLQHRANHELIGQLEIGELSTQAFFQELLRLVYRLLFLCVAEDRRLLFQSDVPLELQQIYREGYSLNRLRDLALRGSAYEAQHADLWKVQRLVFVELNRGNSSMELPGLGGLFAQEQCPHLNRAELANGFLLEAVKAIGWFFDEQSQSRTRINYRDLNTEEFGSVYESLLELNPQINRGGGSRRLVLGGGAGSDRKTSGSYYTPDDLVQELIKSALLPVIRERLKNATTPEEKETGLLAIRVLDPACGSGHFLLAAARRLALVLAQIRAGDDQPSEELRQQCMREVVAKCIYGVDRNPMAVELCKVALWMEAIEPGKPLGFLNAHIQCGDSLVGVFDPKVLEEGIPDEAYKPLTGDDKSICASLKKDNAKQRKADKGNRSLQPTLDLFGQPTTSISQQRMRAIEAMPENTLVETTSKQAAYALWQKESGTDPETLVADLFTATFFLPKTINTRTTVPTTEHLLLLLGKQEIPKAIEKVVLRAANVYRFFHWHLAFPQVMDLGGFHCVLGNPPWERIKLQEKEFFAARSEAIALAPNKAARERLIQALKAPTASETDLVLVRMFERSKREAEGSGEFIRGSGRFPLTAVGDLNTYALFTELFLCLLGSGGRSGVIVPTGIATDNTTKDFFESITSSGRLVSLVSFENEAFIFRVVHHSYKFCLLTLRSPGLDANSALYCFFIRFLHQATDARRFFQLSADDIGLLNPNTRTCPIFRSQADAELTTSIYSRIPILVNDNLPVKGDPWDLAIHTRLFHMAEDSHLFYGEPRNDRLPLYEAKLIHLYDHRWATYESDGSSRDALLSEKRDPAFCVSPRYWVSRGEVKSRLEAHGWNRKWLIGWRNITSAHVLRTVIGTVIPAAGVGHSIALAMPRAAPPREAAAFLANLSSLVCDYLVRQKLAGLNLSFSYLKQLAFISPTMYCTGDLEFISTRVLELTYTSTSLQPWAEDLGWEGAPFAFDPGRRALLQAELDAYYAHLYNLSRDELRYILDPADVMGPNYPSETFRVLKNNEMRQFGEYRTQRLVLEAWDHLFGSQ